MRDDAKKTEQRYLADGDTEWIGKKERTTMLARATEREASWQNLIKLPAMVKRWFQVVIETPRGSAAKIAYDPKSGVFQYSRPLPVGNRYPFDWRFIRSILAEDGDPLDGMVIHQAATAPGVVIKCKVLGALRIKQKDPDGNGIRNDRYIFCPHKEDAPDEPVAADELAPGDIAKGNPVG